MLTNLSYTMVTRAQAAGAARSDANPVSYHIKDQRERTEAAGLVRLVQLDRDSVVQLLVDEKVYTTSECTGLDWPRLVRQLRMSDGYSSTQALALTAGEATVSRHYVVHGIGKENVDGLDADGYQVTTTTTRTGCIGDGTMTSVADLWVASIRGLVWVDRFSKPSTFTIGKCRVNASFGGDTELMGELFGRLLVRRTDHFTVGTLSMKVNTELTNYTTAPVDHTLMEVPPDYQSIEEKDFDDLVLDRMPKWKR